MKRFVFGYFLPLTIIFALPFILHWRLWTTNPTDRVYAEFSNDFGNAFYSSTYYLFSCYKSFSLPLWDPYTLSGHPFLALGRVSVFYPPLLLYSAFIGNKLSYIEYEFFCVMHLAFLGWAIYILLRYWKVSVHGSLLGTFSFIFGGFATTFAIHNPVMIFAITWVPLCILFLDKAFSSKDEWVSNTIVAGTAMGFVTLAGHPQTMLWAYLLLLALWFSKWCYDSNSYILPKSYVLKVIILFHLVFTALGSPTIVSFLQYLPYHTRSTPSLEFSMEGNMGIVHLLEAVIGPFWHSFYWGFLPLVLIILWLPQSPYYWRRFMVFLILVVIYSLGSETALAPVVYSHVPLVGYNRYPERNLWTFLLMMGIFSGFGFDDIFSSSVNKKRTLLLTICSIFFLIGILVFFTKEISGLERTWQVMYPIKMPQEAIFFWALVCLIMWLRLMEFFSPGTLKTVVLMLVVIELFTFNHGLWYTQKEPLEPSKRLRQLRDVPSDFRGNHLETNDYDGNSGYLTGRPDIAGLSPMKLARYDKFIIHALKEPRLFGFLNVKDAPGFCNRFVAVSKAIPAVDSQEVEQLLLKNASDLNKVVIIETASKEIDVTYGTGTLGLYTNATVLEGSLWAKKGENVDVSGPYEDFPPGKYRIEFSIKAHDNSLDNVVADIRVQRSGGAKIFKRRELKGTDFSKQNKFEPFSLTLELKERTRLEFHAHFTGKSDMWLEKINVKRSANGESPIAAPSLYIQGENETNLSIQADFYDIKIKANQASLMVISDKLGWLVYSDNNYPGWECFVNGIETPIYYANLTFKAVKIHEGVNRVLFVYRPRIVLFAIILSLVTFCAVASTIIWRRGLSHSTGQSA